MKQHDSRALFSGRNTLHRAKRPIIITARLRTPENLGNIIRLAANIGCTTVIAIDSPTLSMQKIRRTACMAIDHVELIHTNAENWLQHIPQDYEIVAIETTQTSENIFATRLNEQTAFVVGNEIHGIDADILLRCNRAVHIPMTGPSTSMNVSHATAVVLFEWLRQMHFSPSAE